MQPQRTESDGQTRQWRLVLLGEPQLLAGGSAVRGDRKAMGLLAYLALEGSTPRARLADLLWPEVAERTARNNLSQLMRRLRLAAGLELVVGRETLELAGGGQVDALLLQAHVHAERFAEAHALEGDFLATLDFADLPAFQTWATHTAERLAALWRRAAGAEVGRLEAAGQLTRALALAERLLEREPLSEEAFRRLMRLHFLLGDRAAALGLYERCRRVLREELDAAPMEETVALARDIERGRAPATGAPAPRGALPASVLRPPVLAGRERAWRQLEAAWSAGQLTFVFGEPGMGKSRLVRDFVASRGGSFVFDARPGDKHVPYATTTRCLQQVLASRPDVPLEPWMAREVARLVPGYGDASTPPPPMGSEADRLRFFEAIQEVLSRTTTGVSAMVYDDFQYADSASVAVGEYLFSSLFPLGQGRLPNTFVCCRRGEMPEETMTTIGRMRDAGMAAVVELEPLDEASVRTMLEGMALPGLGSLASDLARYTGGNPLFLAETVKHLLETEGLCRPAPQRLPLPEKVGAVIHRRLERLSRPALQLAQVAALARTAFRLELAAEVLEVSPLDFHAPLAELEAAQILRGDAFTHDLVFEAVLAAIPESLRRLLHRRVAAALGRRKAAPAAVAHHWLEGGETQEAVPYLLEAARTEEASLRHAEAAALRQRAASLALN
jgi:DNA-binding SARP family transcriptional activator